MKKEYTVRQVSVQAPEPGVVVEGRLSGRLNILRDIALHIDSAHGREELLSIIRGESRELLSHDVGLLAVANRAHTHYGLYTLSPIADATELGHKHFSVEEGSMGWSIMHDAPFVGDLAGAPSFCPQVEGIMADYGMRSMLVVPLRTASAVIGSLAFASTNERHYDEQDATVMQLFASALASAMKHAILLEDVKKRVAQIELISTISRRLTSELELNDLLEVAATAIQRNFNYFDVTIFLTSEDEKELVLEAHSGNYNDFLPQGYRQPASEGIIGWVASNGTRALVSDVSLDPRYKVHEYHNTKSELALPIKIENSVAGVLNVEDTRLHAFDDMDAIVLETLCDQLGNAIKNARLYNDVRTANMKLTELDKLKSEFLGIVSHDFRSPLSSIILAAKSLLRSEAGGGNARLLDYLRLITEQALRLTRLAEDTLSIAKIESGQLSFYVKVVNMERLLQDAISLVKQSRYHTLETEVEPKALFIKGDQSKLRQVVQNLVSNAVKYSPRGGKVRVVVSERSEDEIVVSVSDEGIGIPAGQIGKLFQKFTRVNVGEARDIKGTGLGLWICREIIDAHGGTIWVESEEGKGSTFRFTLKKAG